MLAFLIEKLRGVAWPTLLLPAVLLGLAPFTPEPHLWQKLKMLTAGELAKPIDIFDLFLHGTLPLLVLIKLAIGSKKTTPPQE